MELLVLADPSIEWLKVTSAIPQS